MKNDITRAVITRRKHNQQNTTAALHSKARQSSGSIVEKIKTILLVAIFASSTGFVFGIKYTHASSDAIMQKAQALTAQAQKSTTTITTASAPQKK